MATNQLALLEPKRRPFQTRLRKPQPGPVTLAIRALRSNEAPSWEIRQAQINAEEREALRALRKRIKAQINADLERVDRCLAALDLIDGDADVEEDAGNEPEGTDRGGNLDDEPSLCGLTAHLPSVGGDDREYDEAEASGIGDAEGLAELYPFLHGSFGAFA